MCGSTPFNTSSNKLGTSNLSINETPKYHKSLGMLCSSIPALLYLVIMLIQGKSTISPSEIGSLISFIPLILISNFVEDIYSRVPYISRTDIVFLKFIVAWAILFPVARIISDISLYCIWREMPYYIFQFPSYIITLILLGLAYGIFFTASYNFLYRWYRMRARIRGDL